MSTAVYYQLLVPLGLAVLGGLVTYLMRNELADGSERPQAQRILGGLVAFAIIAVLALFASFLPTWFAVYFIVWWVTLFAVLPFGVRSQHEVGDFPAGSDAGAPVEHNMKRKVLITTAISLPVFGLVLLAVRFLPVL